MRTRSLLGIIVGLLVLMLAVAGCRQDAEVVDEPDDEPDEVAEEEPEPDEEPDDEPDAEPDDEVDLAESPGVSAEPCPDGVNDDNGCIYLGSLNDLTVGAFSEAGPLIQEAMEAFWQRVNEDGGIGGYDVDISSHVRDNEYLPEVQTEVFEDIRDDVLGFGMSIGSSPTFAILDDLIEDEMIAVPLAWNSDFLFDPATVETGSNYCVDSMNAVEFYVDEETPIDSIMSVHYPNDYGQDADVGARLAAESVGAEHAGVPTPPGPENQGDAIQAILGQDPDLVILTTNPTDAAAIVGETVAGGYEGHFIGHGPTWSPALLASPAAEAMMASFWRVSPYPTFDHDSAGHQAMQEALADIEAPNDFHTAGWMTQYPIRDALEAAAAEGEINRSTVFEALNSLDSVDFEGALPEDAGNFAGEPNDRALRSSNIGEPAEGPPAGINELAVGFEGSAAAEYDFTEACRDAY